MDTVFMVKGYITRTSEEKAYLYNGTSAYKAFEIYNKFGNAAKAELSIFENGVLVKHFEKTNETPKDSLKWIISDSFHGNDVVVETNYEDATKAFNSYEDSIYDSKYVNDCKFQTNLFMIEINNDKVRLVKSKVIVGEEIDDE